MFHPAIFCIYLSKTYMRNVKADFFQAILVKAILEYSSDADDNRLWYGLVLALAYGCAEVLKCICFVTQWLINYTTGIFRFTFCTYQ